MDLELKNKVAIVTGGSRGLGRAICLALAAEGAHVAVNYCHHKDAAEQLARRIADEHDVKALPIVGDVSKGDDVRRLFELTQDELGPVDILVNNAAAWPTACVKDMSREHWNQTMALNLTAPFLTCREAVRRWLDAGRTGRIVNIISQAAFHGSTTGHADYAASKAALVSFTIALAREVAARGIAVNAVSPGFMNTDMVREALAKNRKRYIERIPLGRIADPSEMAVVVTFVASEKAGYMTGATVNVSGGMLMR